MSKLNKLLPELEKYNDYETIKGIQFSLFSHEMIKNGSVCNIITPDTYDGNLPKDKGLFDLKMGTLDNALLCKTDENNSELCPGYFGSVDLGKPVFYYHYLPYIEKLLKCVCFRCSNVLLNKSDPNVLKMIEGKKGYNRFNTIAGICSKIKTCKYNNGCHMPQPKKYSKISLRNIKEKDNIIKIIAEFDDSAISDLSINKSQLLTPEIIYNIFVKITDENVDFLGFNRKYSRPEWMICKYLPVPPPPVRPSVRQDNSNKSEDDLTYALSQIINKNKMLKDKINTLNELDNSNASQETLKNIKNSIAQFQGLLQYHITTYMDNTIPGIPSSAHNRSNRLLKTITQRLKSKHGRIRLNIQGKRVDYSARTVISVDPNIDIDEYGVPQSIVMNLTFPEIVTKFNIDRLTRAVRNGPYNYPGAKSFKRKDSNNNISLLTYVINDELNLEDLTLNIGDVVERHLIDGDYALFNRQPSLHRMSMMAHKIKVVPFNTFRLNVTVTSPYNADFDKLLCRKQEA
jgi:DNA-directed RNA polymerase II subunit RPB1